MINFKLNYNRIKPKQKSVNSFYGIYESKKWIIFSFDDQVVINQKNYSLFNKLTKNWKDDILKFKINKKALIIGEYNKIMPVYSYLRNNNIKAYVCYI